MKGWVILCCCLTLSVNAQQAKKVHQRLLLADTHNDLLTTVIEKNLLMDADLRGKTHSDLKRFKEAGVDLQLFSVWCDGDMKNPYAWANREMDTLYAVAARNPDKITLARTSRDIRKIVRKGRLAAMFGVEGGHMLEGKIDRLDSFYQRGVRYMTLTWNNSTDWASSAMSETSGKLTQKGLSAFGKQIVQRMNALGMLVDLSHVGEQTFWDAIQLSTKPILVSHSNAYALAPVFRNLKDEQIRAVGKNGGVIQLNFNSGFVDSSFYRTGVRPELSQLLDHLDYIVKLIGVDHVGMGSDFDGITSTPKGLDDVTDYYKITEGLLQRGYSKKSIRKIMGENFLRVLRASEQ